LRWSQNIVVLIKLISNYWITCINKITVRCLQKYHKGKFYCIYIFQKHMIKYIIIEQVIQTFWNSSDRQTQRAENHKDRQYYQVCRSGCPTNLFVCVFCFATEISKLDSASNDIYFLNMQLFPVKLALMVTWCKWPV
jgi:hypothetical protein